MGRGNIVFVFQKWFSKYSIHLSTGMLVYRDLMSRQAKDLFLISMLIILLRSKPELLMCASLIAPNNGDNVLAKSFTML